MSSVVAAGQAARSRFDWWVSVDRLIVVAVCLVVWQVLFLVVGSTGLASPLDTLRTAAQLLMDGSFWLDIWATGFPFLIAVVIEIVIGILLGVWFGLSRLAGDVAEPIVLGLYSVPKVVFYPIILMLFGIGIWAEVIFAVLHGILPVTLFTMTSVRTLKPVYLKTARVMQLPWWETFQAVAVPAAFPEIFSGIRIGISVSLLGVLLCEMFGSKNGLGFRLVSAMGGSRINEVIAVAVLLILAAFCINLVLLDIDRRLRRG